MKNNMIKKGITLKKNKEFYIVDDVDTIDNFATIRKIMLNKSGKPFYGRKMFIGLKQLDEYLIV